ncbi:MAG: SsrA-binding protein SmpB [Bdellovibrionaceae bacterium]|nr:SsrA-binding protein SmpB [Pseudobdellovibrionaceae bacterium]MBC7456999.1 SsrA-binding protein SmpB [Pseudobdellovibrionaceae bacterium]
MTASILLIQDNKQARFNYQIIDTYEAGLVLVGSEVKSIRARSIQLKDAYVSFKDNEAFLQNAHISEYKASSYNNHAPERLRKLLLNHKELAEIASAIKEKGLSCVPLKIYFKDGRVKVEIALVKGKKTHDKRESIKKQDVDRQLRRVTQKDR